MNLETQVLATLAGGTARDLPPHVYPKGKQGYLYFVAKGVCQRMPDDPASPAFLTLYAELFSRLRKPKRKPRAKTPHKARPLPSVGDLRMLFNYDAATGHLIYRAREPWMFDADHRMTPESQAATWNAKNAGRRACRLSANRRYLCVTVDGKATLAHRVIWKMMRGKDPQVVDHINGDGHDNRLENLRSVSLTENARNKPKLRGKLTGIYRRRDKWAVSVSGKHAGVFGCLGEAVKAREIGEKALGYLPR